MKSISSLLFSVMLLPSLVRAEDTLIVSGETLTRVLLAGEEFNRSGDVVPVEFPLSDNPADSRTIEINSDLIVRSSDSQPIKVFPFRDTVDQAGEFTRLTLSQTSEGVALSGLVARGGQRYSVSHQPSSRLLRLSKVELDFACGVRNGQWWLPRSSQFTSREILGSSILIAEIATDADTRLIQTAGGRDAAAAAVLSALNSADAILTEELGVRLRLVFQNFWITEDPYGSVGSDSGLLLDRFERYWENGRPFGGPYDLIHLFSGRGELDSGGIAFVSGACRYGYGLSVGGTQVDALTVAHELGHSLGAQHDNCVGLEWVMCPLGTDEENPRFSPKSKFDINSYLSTVSCLETEDVENRPPTLTPPGNRSTVEGDLFSYQLQATDPDAGEVLRYSVVSGLPAGAFLDTTSGAFTWRPAGNQSGTYDIVFRVQDSSNAADTETMRLTVANRAGVADMPARHALGDFDGDGRADLSVFRNGTGDWFSVGVSSPTLRQQQFGLPGDTPVPGDYNGDRISDQAVFRADGSLWFIRLSGSGSVLAVQFGLAGDIPVPADYDGDGRTDLAVWRPATGLFIVRRSSTEAISVEQWGLPGDIPVPCDYNNDGQLDLAVFRQGTWFIRGVGTSVLGDRFSIPVPGNYNGAGNSSSRCERAVYHPRGGIWQFENGSQVQYGLGNDTPVPADYNGDGRLDLGVFRRSSAVFFIRGIAERQFGLFGDLLPLKESYYFAARSSFGDTRLSRNTDQADLYFYLSGSRLLSSLFGSVSRVIPPAPTVRFADYDGDRQVDVATVSNGIWQIYTASNQLLQLPWGTPGDIAETGDFDADGKSDVAVYRDGNWLILQSRDATAVSIQWGLPGDLPVAADFNADGFTDLAVYRSATSTWFIRDTRSGEALPPIQWGLPGDTPRIADIDRDARPDLIAYRQGAWFVLQSGGDTRATAWGLPGDIPTPLRIAGFSDFAVLRPGAQQVYALSLYGVTRVFNARQGTALTAHYKPLPF